MEKLAGPLRPDEIGAAVEIDMYFAAIRQAELEPVERLIMHAQIVSHAHAVAGEARVILENRRFGLKLQVHPRKAHAPRTAKAGR